MNIKILSVLAITLLLILITVGSNVYADCSKCHSCNPDKCGSEKMTTMKTQTVCPVMGGKIDKAQYVDHQGKRIYFQDAKCKVEFQKNPEKYMKNLKGIKLENTPKAQTICPVMGEKINRQFYVDHNGKRIYFCCGQCIDEFKKDPEKYLKKLKGVQLDKTPEK